jgi:hypothetical protein
LPFWGLECSHYRQEYLLLVLLRKSKEGEENEESVHIVEWILMKNQKRLLIANKMLRTFDPLFKLLKATFFICKKLYSITWLFIL